MGFVGGEKLQRKWGRTKKVKANFSAFYLFSVIPFVDNELKNLDF